MFSCCIAVLATTLSADQDDAQNHEVRDKRVRDVVHAAFVETHAGWSSDEVLLQNELQEAFLRRCKEQLPNVKSQEFNRTLLNLRKAGQLKVEVSQRRADRHDDYRHVAEIAARLLSDKHHATTDQIMCDPKLRMEFDEVARTMRPDVDAYLLRKAAFGLRKARQLKPEFVVRVADWGRTITEFTVAELRHNSEKIPNKPGVYIFRDATGYLYVGEAAKLRTRLTNHLNESDRLALANYLSQKTGAAITVEIHAFDPKSKAMATRMRRAYESELIASRKPKFNLRP
ncbi:MAG: GIY-YIG nuclease family protein [Planctomycetales bacterium]|nr:GIY-YIG nuclease family protein [Planctomycetales bacterium]